MTSFWLCRLTIPWQTLLAKVCITELLMAANLEPNDFEFNATDAILIFIAQLAGKARFFGFESCSLWLELHVKRVDDLFRLLAYIFVCFLALYLEVVVKVLVPIVAR